jgi:SAM-dependent methyltransferase
VDQSRFEKVVAFAKKATFESSGTAMTSSCGKYTSEIAAAKAHAETHRTTPEFRNYWLGLTEESRDFRAQMFRAFGELVGSVTGTLCGWRILDYGCGDGRWLRFFLEYDAKPEDVVGVDVSDARFALGVPKNPLVRLVKTDGATLPFDNQCFDLITQFVCFSAIPTLALRQHTAREIDRVLKRGGYLFWWDSLKSNVPSERDAQIEPQDYFAWPMLRKDVAQHPKPSEGLRPFPGARLVGRLLDRLSYSPTHVAALIGPKP